MIALGIFYLVLIVWVTFLPFLIGSALWVVRTEREWRTLIRAYLETQADRPLPREDESEPGKVYPPIAGEEQ